MDDTPLWENSRFSTALRDEAVLRGMDFLAQIGKDDEDLRKHGFDLLWSFQTITASGAAPAIRKRARAVGVQLAERWRALVPRLASNAPTRRVREAAMGLSAAERLGVAHEQLRSDLVYAASARGPRALYGLDPNAASGNPPAAEHARHMPAVLADGGHTWKQCMEAFIWSFVGARVGVPLGAAYTDVLRLLPRLRPWRPASEVGQANFRGQGYVVTHVIYTLSDYNELSLDPALVPDEFAFLRAGLPHLVEARNNDLLGEFMDALRTLGVDESDPDFQRACTFMLESQNPDGSWGGLGEASVYKRYHATLTALEGLRTYRRRGAGPLFPWTKGLLERWSGGGDPEPRPKAQRRPATPRRARANARPAPPHVDRVASLPSGLRHYARLDQPVVLTHTFSDHPARRWTVDHLRSAVGQRPVRLEYSDDEVFSGPGRYDQVELTTFAAALDALLDPPNPQRSYYLAQQRLETVLPELLPEAAPPPCLDWVPASHLLRLLWVSPGNTVSPLHRDHMDNLFLLIQGTKRFRLYPPSATPRLHPHARRRRGAGDFSQVDPEAPDLERFPQFVEAPTVTVDLQAGDALYLPAGWWHHVRSSDLNVALSFWWHPPALG